jgi:hypothetical protein
LFPHEAIAGDIDLFSLEDILISTLQFSSLAVDITVPGKILKRKSSIKIV